MFQRKNTLSELEEQALHNDIDSAFIADCEDDLKEFKKFWQFQQLQAKLELLTEDAKVKGLTKIGVAISSDKHIEVCTTTNNMTITRVL